MISSPANATESYSARAEEHMEAAELYAVICTYHRVQSLRRTLAALSSQTRPPDHVVIVDNGSLAEVEKLAGEFGAEYLDARENLGPAGGFGLGMEYVLGKANPHDWLVTMDDETGLRTKDRFAELWKFAGQCLAFHQRVAAVGSNGALYHRESGRFVRILDSQLTGPVAVDYLAGTQFHRVTALRALGPYRAELFFGFEEAEYGLRAKRAGWALFAHGSMWFEDREARGKLGVKRPRSDYNAAVWRRYYSARNSTVLAKEYGVGRVAALRVAVRTGLSGTLALIRSRRPLAEVVLPVRGSIDGARGRLGRTINPAAANKSN